MKEIGKPLISVVIPTYNREKVLKSSIDSVLNQNYTNLELIIADDCSDDNTENLVKNMMKKDRRIKYVRGARNMGAGGARNMGASMALGDYIAFNDSDAIWQKEKLERQLAMFQEHSEEEVGLIFHAYILVEKSKEEKCQPFEDMPKDFKGEIKLVHLMDEPLADTSAMMIPMKIWKSIGGFDERLRCLEDYELSMRIAAKYKTYYFHDPLIKTYYSEGSVNQNWKEGIKTYFYVLEEFHHQYREYDILQKKRIFLIWDLCTKLGQGAFFSEQLMLYLRAIDEDKNKFREQMQDFMDKYAVEDRIWDII